MSDPLLESLNKGVAKASELPAVYLQNDKIVDPDSKEGQEFQHYLERIAKKVAPSHSKPVLYLLSDSEKERAYTFAGFPTQIVCFTKGMLKNIDNEDQLAFIVGHELRHDSFKQKYGHVPNTIEQERDCDREAIDGMLNKDEKGRYSYNINEAVNILFKFAAKEGVVLGTLGILDVHGIPQLRAETAKLYVSSKLNDLGDMPEPKTTGADLSFKEFQRQMGHAAYTSYEKQFAKKYPDYGSQSVEEKLASIRKEITTLDVGMNESEKFLRNQLNVLPLDSDNMSHQNALVETLDAIYDRPEAFDLYPAIALRLKVFDIRKEPYGKLTRVSDDITAFVKAESREEAALAAKKIISFFDRADTEVNTVAARSVDWPNFHVSKKRHDAKKAPWTKQVAWAKEEIKAKRYDTAKALWYLGISPPSLFEMIPDDILKQWPKCKAIGYPTVDSHAHSFENIVLDSDGEIERYVRHANEGNIGMANNYVSQKLDELDAKAKKAEKSKGKKVIALPSIDTRNLQPLALAKPREIIENIAGYISTHSTLRSPWREDGKIELEDEKDSVEREENTKTAWERHYDSANLLLNKLREGIAQDRNTFAPWVRKFFIDHDPYTSVDAMLDSTKYGGPVFSTDEVSLKTRFRPSVHPYVSYVLSDPDGLFSLKDKMEFMGHADKTVPLGRFDTLLSLKTGKPLKKSELTAQLQTYCAAAPHSYPPQVFGGAMLVDYLSKDSNKKEIVDLLLKFPTMFDYTCDNSVAFAAASGQCANATMNVELSKFSKEGDSEYNYYLANFLNHPVTAGEKYRQNRRVIRKSILSVKDWPQDADKLVTLYQTMERGKLFPNAKFQHDFAEKVIAALERIKEPEKRYQFLLHLLTEQEIQLPYLRNMATDMWAESALQILGGQDPGYTNGHAKAYAAASAEDKPAHMTQYHKKLSGLIAPVREKMSTPRQIEMLAKLADVLQTQKEITEDLGQVQFALDHDGLMKATGKISLSEGLLQIINQEKNLRRATIDFLTSSISNESTKAYSKAIDIVLDKRADLETQAVFNATEAGSGSDEELSELETLKETNKQLRKRAREEQDKDKRYALLEQIRENNENIRELRTGSGDREGWLKEQKVVDKKAAAAIRKSYDIKKFTNNPSQQLVLHSFYENFWAAPLLGRVAIIDQLLTTADEKVEDYAVNSSLLGQHFKDSLNYTIDKVIPETAENASTIRIMLRAYTMSVDQSQASLFVAAALAAGRSSQESGKPLNASEIAAKILMSMGPFERKICQAISNSPELDASITVPFGTSKGEGIKLPRWQDMKRYHEITTPEFREPIKRFGKRLGGASIFTNYELQEENGARYAFGIKEANARDKANRGEATARRFVDNLRKLDKSLADKIPETLEDILAVAGRATQEELDPETGRIQHTLLKRLHDDITVTVEGKPFHFSAANLAAYGEDFRYTTIVDGDHLQHAAETLGATKEEQRDIATAHLTVILRNWLGGVPEDVRGYYDTDDHDAQGRAKRGADGVLNHYGRFDPGGISLNRRSEADSRQLANSLFNVLLDHLGGKPLSKAMHEEITRVRAADPQKKTPEHLVASQRTLLAASKFIEAAGSENVVKILAALYQANQIDPVIKATIEERFNDPAQQMQIMEKVAKFAEEEKMDMKVLDALQSFQGGSEKPFVTITQNHDMMISEPKYYKIDARAPLSSQTSQTELKADEQPDQKTFSGKFKLREGYTPITIADRESAFNRFA